jgi:hypothetical protein
MPNHTANNFTITGPLVDIHRFIKAVKSETNLDFNGIVPMPEKLRNTTSPVRVQTQAEIDEAWATWNKRKEAGELKEWELREGKPFGLGITVETQNALLAECGFDNWYDWSVINWGTKWNAYDVGEWSIDEGANGHGRATIYYETAWSPVSQLWFKASLLYPTLEFFHEFADEGGSFLGDETISNGAVIHENEYDWNSDEGKALREGLGRYSPDEDEDEDEESVEA